MLFSGSEFSKLIEEKKEYEEQLTKAMEEQLTKEIEEENQNSLKCSIDRICLQLNYVEKLLKQVPAFDREQDLTLVNWCKDADLSQIPHHLRWRMYITWVNELVDVLNKEICGLETNCRFHFENLKEIEILESSEVCGNADIIGVTTTGAANHRALLGHLNSKIGKLFEISFNSIFLLKLRHTTRKKNPFNCSVFHLSIVKLNYFLFYFQLL